MTKALKPAETYTHTHTHTGKFLPSLKQIGTICFCIILSVPSLANIDAENDSPTCDESVLNANNGTANLEINWEPNVIPLRWYSGNTLLEPENNDDTCTYDGVLNKPTNPTREGYNFAGWRVRPTMEFSTIPTNQDFIERWSKGWSNNKSICKYGIKTENNRVQIVACSSDVTLAKLQTLEWKLKFEHGDLYGMAGCSTEGEGLSRGTRGNPTIDNSVGTYCWCKATGYKPNNSDTIYGPSKTLSWVFALYDKECWSSCASHCTYNIGLYGYVRRAVLTPAGN